MTAKQRKKKRKEKSKYPQKNNPQSLIADQPISFRSDMFHGKEVQGCTRRHNSRAWTDNDNALMSYPA